MNFLLLWSLLLQEYVLETLQALHNLLNLWSILRLHLRYELYWRRNAHSLWWVYCLLAARDSFWEVWSPRSIHEWIAWGIGVHEETWKIDLRSSSSTLVSLWDAGSSNRDVCSELDHRSLLFIYSSSPDSSLLDIIYWRELASFL